MNGQPADDHADRERDQRPSLAQGDHSDVREVVCGISMTSIDEYVADLRSAGFVDITATDLTTDWAPYAAVRLKKWRQDREAYARVHGEGAYAAQEKFYSVIDRLYESGSLGGLRLTAGRP